MNATSLYVTTSRLVFQQNYDCTSTDQNWKDLYRLVPYLRQSLSCTVCGHMLIEPHKPSDGKCQHHICRGCVRGRKNLKPTCIWCRDNFNLERYEENTQMRLLLQCYKSLCQYIINTPIYQLINNQTKNLDSGNSGSTSNSCIITNGVTIPNATLLEFIEEGACFQDNFKSNSGLTKSAYSILPCVFNPPQQQTTTSSSSSSFITTSPAQQQISSSYNRQHESPSLLISTPTPSPPSYIPQQQQQFQQIFQIHQNNSIPATIIGQQQHKIYNQQAPPPLALVNNITCLTPATSNLPAVLGTTTGITNTIQQQGRIINSNKLATINNQIQLNQQLQQHQQHQQYQQKHNNVINETTSAATACTISTTTTASVEQQKNNVPIAGATGTVQQISNPPPIKTVSNGSAMYSVLYTGIGNKITIKRKTDGDDDSTNKKYTNLPPPSRPIINNNNKTSTSSKRRGCRCGNATATPGKLTCCGQRCPCYVDSKSCIDCKCRGCRNPHRPDGGKIRPMIPELACYEIQMADDSTNLPTSSVTGSSSGITNTITTQSTQQQFQQQQLNISSSNNYTTIANNNKNKQQNRMEISLEDFNNTNLSSLIGANGILCSSGSDSDTYGSPLGTTTTTTVLGGGTTISPQATTCSAGTTTTTHVIPMMKKHQQQTKYAFTTNQTLKRHPTSQLQQQTVKLENTSRESLLIKSADGKYQVVNVYTSTPHQTSNLQRFHTIQTSINNNSNNLNNNNNKTINTISGLQLHQRTINQSSTQNHQIPEISTTLPQLLLQPQSHQHNNNNSTTTILTTGLNTFHNNNNHHHQHQNNINSIISSGGHNSLNHQQSPTTITLSPIIVTSAASSSSNFPSELFNDVVPKTENCDHLSV